MSQSIEEARAALRERQGAGARYDARNAPARELDWARRGTAYFARLLNELSDADLDAPSFLPGLSRRHIVAHIGYHARIISELVAWVRVGQRGPFPRPFEVSSADIAQGATLPVRALRYLFHHSEVHLNVEWRDLTDADWGACVTDAVGRRVALRETPEIRARALWLHAVDLGSGGRFVDMPPEFVDALTRQDAAGQATGTFQVLSPSDRQVTITAGDMPTVTVTGRAADIARWTSGRGASGLRTDKGKLPHIPFGMPGLDGP